MSTVQASSVEEIRRATADAWDALASAVEGAAGAWDERILEPEGEGDAWSPRLAAWHAISGERIRAAYLRHLLAERPAEPDDMMMFAASPASGGLIGALRDEYRHAASPDDVARVLTEARRGAEQLVDDLSASDLTVTARLNAVMESYLREHGEAPEGSVRGVLVHGVVHMGDHARQIAAGTKG
jgi:hypothetical protein